MTAISNPLKPRPDHPLDPMALAVIAEIQEAAETLGVPVFIAYVESRAGIEAPLKDDPLNERFVVGMLRALPGVQVAVIHARRIIHLFTNGLDA